MGCQLADFRSEELVTKKYFWIYKINFIKNLSLEFSSSIMYSCLITCCKAPCENV